MAANYPGSLPVKEAAGANLSTNPHSQLHDDMYDEIVAIGTELGTAPSGAETTVKARLDRVTPTLGAWTPWTPTWATTIGNATVDASYIRIGRLVVFELDVIIGSTTDLFGSEVRFSLPFNMTNSIAKHLGSCTLYDATGPTFYSGAFLSNDADDCRIRREAATGGLLQLSSSAPFTWTTGDRIRGYGRYQAVAD